MAVAQQRCGALGGVSRRCGALGGVSRRALGSRVSRRAVRSAAAALRVYVTRILVGVSTPFVAPALRFGLNLPYKKCIVFRVDHDWLAGALPLLGGRETDSKISNLSILPSM